MKNSKVLGNAGKTVMSIMMCLSMASVANPFLHVHAEEIIPDDDNIQNVVDDQNDEPGDEQNPDEQYDDQEQVNDQTDQDNDEPNANEHGLYHVDAVEPTCETEGIIEYWHDGEGHFFADENGEIEIDPDDIVVEALGHDYGEWVVIEEPTHETEGLERRICSRDESHIEEQPIDIIENHIWGEWVVVKTPTGTEDGRKERECEICGAVESVPIPLIGHICDLEFIEGFDATCTEDGLYNYFVCTENSSHKFWDEFGEDPAPEEELIIPAYGHDWGEWVVTKEAKCDQAGEKTRECAVCHEKETEEIEPIGHDWSEWRIVTEPTCSHVGEKTRTCGRCNKVETAEIAKLEHTWGDWETVKEATCTDKGEKRRVCKVCGEIETKETDKLGHKWGDWTINKKATCTQNGSKTHVCGRCKKSETVEIDAIGHSWGEWTTTKAATETTTGEIKRVCKNDSSHVETQVVPATGKNVAPNTYDGGIFGNVMAFSSSTIVAIASAVLLKKH